MLKLGAYAQKMLQQVVKHNLLLWIFSISKKIVWSYSHPGKCFIALTFPESHKHLFPDKIQQGK